MGDWVEGVEEDEEEDEDGGGDGEGGAGKDGLVSLC